jgi:hypothetical protein
MAGFDGSPDRDGSTSCVLMREFSGRDDDIGGGSSPIPSAFHC